MSQVSDYGSYMPPKTFVLCFDGTGNKFSGTEADSNVLKIFRMLDRNQGRHFHYYQPGIGTYVSTASLSNTGLLSRIKGSYMKAKDSAVGSSFAEHVVGGYRFLMRYYSPGDDIYFFGFSRGAYTARFLAEMLDFVGLLTAGNEELVHFAWKTFSKWQQRSGDSEEDKLEKMKLFRYMKAFRETFSRPIKQIRFLGLFDTVNSVPSFESAWMQRNKFPYTARSSAKVIRHAVVDEEFHTALHSSSTQGHLHDCLEFGSGLSAISVIIWKIMEYLPFRRMDLQADGSWKPIRWPLPCGEVRDIPADAHIHVSAIRRMRADKNYRPGNLILGGGGRGVRRAPEHLGIGEWVVAANEGDVVRETYMRKARGGCCPTSVSFSVAGYLATVVGSHVRLSQLLRIGNPFDKQAMKDYLYTSPERMVLILYARGITRIHST
ncbi:hypothetical protein CISG_10055 [Coccidioides immitis RMSCC 3703]|uniref:T6SS Phospholipase effector Tle1-like catalytic domain-containing protein n=1 Tax=Coccidioides immitis RMSCC 3703 TaxID=454286 RepID=A0A0J8QLM2_COCIT|nr:hypothetical protein CISG_10055 [Coccidioides immitis RMSCC 3703]